MSTGKKSQSEPNEGEKGRIKAAAEEVARRVAAAKAVAASKKEEFAEANAKLKAEKTAARAERTAAKAEKTAARAERTATLTVSRTRILLATQLPAKSAGPFKYVERDWTIETNGDGSLKSVTHLATETVFATAEKAAEDALAIGKDTLLVRWLHKVIGDQKVFHEGEWSSRVMDDGKSTVLVLALQRQQMPVGSLADTFLTVPEAASYALHGYTPAVAEAAKAYSQALRRVERIIRELGNMARANNRILFNTTPVVNFEDRTGPGEQDDGMMTDDDEDDDEDDKDPSYANSEGSDEGSSDVDEDEDGMECSDKESPPLLAPLASAPVHRNRSTSIPPPAPTRSQENVFTFNLEEDPMLGG
jgi:hypothetical protein